MRYALTVLIGHALISGIHARALTSVDYSLDRSTTKFDLRHIAENSFYDVHNDEFSKRTIELDSNHIEDHTVNDLRGNGLAKRASPSRPSNQRPTNNRPKPGRPGAGEELESAEMALERTSLSDTSDLVQVAPCGGAKRDLKGVGFHIPLKQRMSGQELALTWEEWKVVLNEVEDELSVALEGVPQDQKIKIFFVGGISGIMLGSRGPGGRTGDIDFVFDSATSPQLKDTFKKCVDRMVSKNPGKFEIDPNVDKPNPINDMWAEISGDAVVETVSERGGDPAWEGKFISAFHLDWRLQLINKMARMARMRGKGYGIKERDRQDAKVFLEKVKQIFSNSEVNIGDFKEWGLSVGKSANDAMQAVAGSLKLLIGDDLTGFSQLIKEYVQSSNC